MTITPYRPGAISTGPFDCEPWELWPIVSSGADGSDHSGDDIVAATRAWLLGALEEGGVALGAADREIVHVIAEDGWSVAQVVAGWALRARPTPSTPCPS